MPSTLLTDRRGRLWVGTAASGALRRTSSMLNSPIITGIATFTISVKTRKIASTA